MGRDIVAGIVHGGRATLAVGAAAAVITICIGICLGATAGLSFLGLSDPNVMSWGLMIGSNRPFILDAWRAVTFPGVAIFLTVLSVSLIGDGVNDALNPRLRDQ